VKLRRAGARLEVNAGLRGERRVLKERARVLIAISVVSEKERSGKMQYDDHSFAN